MIKRIIGNAITASLFLACYYASRIDSAIWSVIVMVIPFTVHGVFSDVRGRLAAEKQFVRTRGVCGQPDPFGRDWTCALTPHPYSTGHAYRAPEESI